MHHEGGEECGQYAVDEVHILHTVWRLRRHQQMHPANNLHFETAVKLTGFLCCRCTAGFCTVSYSSLCSTFAMREIDNLRANHKNRLWGEEPHRGSLPLCTPAKTQMNVGKKVKKMICSRAQRMKSSSTCIM